MRLIEVTLSLMIFSLFSCISLSACCSLKKIQDAYVQKEKAFSRDKYMVSSFKKISMKKESRATEVQEWRRHCQEQYQPEQLYVEECRGKNGSFIRATWLSQNCVCTVVTRTEEQ